jgi:hypothetical protein
MHRSRAEDSEQASKALLQSLAGQGNAEMRQPGNRRDAAYHFETESDESVAK